MESIKAAIIGAVIDARLRNFPEISSLSCQIRLAPTEGMQIMIVRRRSAFLLFWNLTPVTYEKRTTNFEAIVPQENLNHYWYTFLHCSHFNPAEKRVSHKVIDTRLQR